MNENDELKNRILETILGADEVYIAVVRKLDMDPKDEIYQALVLAMLKRQTRDHLVFSVWNNLNDVQALHLKDFIKQYSVIDEDKSVDEVVLEFSLMYDELMEKIFKSLSEFFQEFIKRFNDQFNQSSPLL